MAKTRKFSFFIYGLVIILGLIYFMIVLRPLQQYYATHYIKIHGTYLLEPLNIQDFNLTDTLGRTFTKANLKDHWSFLYFGFTRCEMICPTTLSMLNKTYHLLEKNLPATELPQVIFISIDPDRDSIKLLNDYVTQFNPHFIGARTANPTALEEQFHVISIKKPTKGASYTINHSPDIILVNPDAKIQAYFSYPEQPEQLAKDYNSIIVKKTT